jgi:hypothetical protein
LSRKSKRKLREGTFFGVPLMKGGYCLGIIARQNKGIALGYFFNKIYSDVPSINIADAEKNKVILIAKFSGLEIEEGAWPIIETDTKFCREEWPIPVMKMEDPLRSKFYGVLYDETLLSDIRVGITEEEAARMFKYGLYGSIALQKKLESLIRPLYST